MGNEELNINLIKSLFVIKYDFQLWSFSLELLQKTNMLCATYSESTKKKIQKTPCEIFSFIQTCWQ